MRMALPLPRELFASSGEPAPSFEHVGELSWSDFPALAKRVKALLAAERLEASQGRRAFSSFVEMTYNVMNHGVPAEPRAGEPGRRVPARVALGVHDGLAWIATANLVSAGAAPELERCLQALAAIDADRIHAVYRDVLVRTGDGGRQRPGRMGGLGLLTLARDAALPMEFEIAPAAGLAAALFRLKVTV